MAENVGEGKYRTILDFVNCLKKVVDIYEGFVFKHCHREINNYGRFLLDAMRILGENNMPVPVRLTVPTMTKVLLLLLFFLL